jgi:hypothetical protein
LEELGSKLALKEPPKNFKCQNNNKYNFSIQIKDSPLDSYASK